MTDTHGQAGPVPPADPRDRGGEAAGGPAAGTPRRRPVGWGPLAAAVILALAAGAFLLVLAQRAARPSEDEIRGAVFTAIQRETPESFLVTGAIDLTATVTVRNTRRLLPGIVGLNLGTTSATVRMPGRVSYGLDLSRLGPEDIRVEEDGLVTLSVPPPRVWSAEPMLSDMEVQTEVGWARLYSRSGRAVEQEAIRLMEGALRRQGDAHLNDSDQPRRNSARALETLLTPPLVAAGVERPRIRVLFTEVPRSRREDIE